MGNCQLIKNINTKIMSFKRFYKNHKIIINAFLLSIILLIIFALQNNTLANNRSQNQITKISITDHKNFSKLEFSLTEAIKYRVFTINNPERLVIDLDNTSLKTSTQNISHPLFLSIRNNIDQQKKLRIVFDLKHSIKINNSEIIKSQNNKQNLIINFSPESQIPNRYTIKSDDQIYKLLNRETNKVKYASKKPKSLPIIIIDSGHGGKDPGTIGKYIRSKEKYITLNYARELKKQLDKTKKFKVLLTRNKDYFIPLQKRVSIARGLKADLFISLHANYSPNKETSGFSIYTLSEKSSDKESELLARKENKSDIIGGANFGNTSGDILKTLINLSQRSTMNESAKFAEIVIKLIKKNKIETLQETHRFAGFRVLTAPDIPSVLIELGYLSNKKEEKKLNNPEYKRKVSNTLVVAIERYFINR